MLPRILKKIREASRLVCSLPQTGRHRHGSTPAAVVDRHPSDFANVGAHNIFTILPASQASTVANAETHGMAAFRGRCEVGGLPSQVCDILLASWRDGTKKDTKVPGSYGLAGVCQGIPVHFQPL